MTPAEVRALLEAVIDARMVPQWPMLIVGFVGAAIVGGLIAWFGSYLRVKAQNFATTEDIDRLTEQLRATTRATEEIKAEISGQLWEIQTRWSFKRDLYVRLLEGLMDAAFAMRQLSFLDGIYRDPKQADIREATKEDTNRYLDLLHDHMTKLRAAQAVAPIVLHKDALTALDDLLVAWVKAQSDYNAKSLEALRQEVIRTMTRLTEAAKRDLLVRPAEGDKDL